MDLLTHYVIFHKVIFQENIPDLDCFVYLGANESIKKEIDPTNLKHRLRFEYATPGYNQMYQMLDFRDNSVLLNYPSPPTSYVGFCQYDMPVDKIKFTECLKELSTVNNLLVGFFPYSFHTICDVLDVNKWNSVLSVYNTKYNTRHTMNDLEQIPFFLMNTYILPSWYYTKQQENLKILLPFIIKHLNYSMIHIAGTMERLNALLIACAIVEGTLTCYISDAITDNRNQTVRNN
jgi:hypothetical protein